jgi:hypothetical protein
MCFTHFQLHQAYISHWTAEIVTVLIQWNMWRWPFLQVHHLPGFGHIFRDRIQWYYFIYHFLSWSPYPGHLFNLNTDHPVGINCMISPTKNLCNLTNAMSFCSLMKINTSGRHPWKIQREASYRPSYLYLLPSFLMRCSPNTFICSGRESVEAVWRLTTSVSHWEQLHPLWA